MINNKIFCPLFLKEFDSSNHLFLSRNDTPERIIMLDKLLIVDCANSTTEIFYSKQNNLVFHTVYKENVGNIFKTK